MKSETKLGVVAVRKKYFFSTEVLGRRLFFSHFFLKSSILRNVKRNAQK